MNHVTRQNLRLPYMACGPSNCDELWMEGATVAVMGVPESLAYAEIAGLPHVPWWHIVAAIVGCRKR